MNLRTSLILILVVIVVLAGLFFWNRSRNVVLEGAPTSPVLVDIITPTLFPSDSLRHAISRNLPENDEVASVLQKSPDLDLYWSSVDTYIGTTISKGETLSILAQAWSPNPITTLQLWMDGEMLSEENVEEEKVPVKISWDLEVAEPGVHTLFVYAKDNQGEEGQSQTLIFNVAAGGYQEIFADAGDTLNSIASETGLPADQLASLNPGLDSTQPLGDGQSVILPPSNEGSSQTSLEDLGTNDLVIRWQFTPTSEVDNSYCYQSIGGENWQRIPGLPFSFLHGDEWLQTYFVLPAVQQFNIFLECWGWQNGELTYLGEGETSLDYKQIPDEILITGPGFEAEGLPEMKPLEGDIPVEEFQLPAPFALREAESVAECTSHGWAAQICEELLNGSPKQYIVLVWEWSPGFCWGPCPWGESIDGYQIWQHDPYYGAPVSKDVPYMHQKVAAFPLPWGARCYSVLAYKDIMGQGRVYSDPSVTCGEPPETEELVLFPKDWLSTERLLKIDCNSPSVTGASVKSPAGSQIMVGAWFQDLDPCRFVGDINAAVKFDTPGLAHGSVIHRALLRFHSVDIHWWVGEDVAPAKGEAPGNCVSRVGMAKQDWTGLSSGHFRQGGNTLSQTAYFSPHADGLALWPSSVEVDVTGLVLNWLKEPETNHGFILAFDWANMYNQGVASLNWNYQGCYSLLDGVELEIQYFAPN